MMMVHACSKVPAVGSSSAQQGSGRRRGINLSSCASLLHLDPEPVSLLRRKKIGDEETKLSTILVSCKNKYTRGSELVRT